MERLVDLGQFPSNLIGPMQKFVDSLPVEYQRQFLYDVQTELCGLSASRKERKHFIKTGKLRTKKKGK